MTDSTSTNHAIEWIAHDIVILKRKAAELRRLIDLNEHMDEVMLRGRNVAHCHHMWLPAYEEKLDAINDDLTGRYYEITLRDIPAKLGELRDAIIKHKETMGMPSTKPEWAHQYGAWLVDSRFRRSLEDDEDLKFMWRATLQQPRIPQPSDDESTT